MLTRILIDKEGKYFFQYDRGALSTHYGQVTASDINEAADGATVLSNRHEKFVVMTPTWLDQYRAISRGPQIMMLKDIGVIIAETGMGPESVVGDAGTGSGAAALAFARTARQVYSFDVEPAHVELGQANARALGTSNVTFEVRDIYAGIPDHAFDVFVCDNPEPWRMLPHVAAIKRGGWLVAYLPSINQTATFVNAVQERPDLHYRKTVELIERHWSIKGQRVRPSSDGVGHTGFLVFVRRIA